MSHLLPVMTAKEPRGPSAFLHGEHTDRGQELGDITVSRTNWLLVFFHLI